LPVILLYEKSNENERVLLKSIFKKRKRTDEDLKWVISSMKKYKSINECFKRAEHFSNLSFDALKIFRPSNEKNIMQNIVSFCINRNY
jgi:octaprenyl-diphosphate synthase